MSNAPLVEQLNDLAAKLADADKVDEQLAKAKAELKSAQESLASVRKELGDAQSGLTAAQKKTAIAFDEEIYAKNQELNDVKKRTADAKEALATVNAELKLSTAKHEGMEASISAMRQKFA